MTVLVGRAFAKYAEFARRLPILVTAEDAAALVTSNQVAEFARYVEQADPSIFGRVAVILSSDPTAIAALGAALVASLALIVVKLASAGPPRRTRTVR
jgi:hypothetical protein